MLRKDFLQNSGLGIMAAILGPHVSALARSMDSPKKQIPLLIPSGDFIELDTPQFKLILNKESQTVVSLQPKGSKGFDFVPSDQLKKRSGDRYYYLGDVTIRLKSAGKADWKEYSSASRRSPVKVLNAVFPRIAAAELNPTFADGMPLVFRRYWEIQNQNLLLSYEIENKTNQEIEIGALGIPMIFNNILTDRKLEEAYHICSFADPYIGLDAGYLQVTRLSGHGPALVVVPEVNAQFEAYKLLHDDKTPRGITFEGFYEWMIHTKAYTENEWKGVEQWNPPSSVKLKPGQQKTYAIKFLLADQIRKIEDTLIDHHRPVAVGIPGYVLPMGQDARVFLKYDQGIRYLNIEPAESLSVIKGSLTKNNWQEYLIKGVQWGRARLTINYSNNLKQTINYKVIKPQRQVLKDLGGFLFTKQWFDAERDPFKRSPSVISYDYFANKQVTQEIRVWIAGLSDEGGNGSWLAAVMKQLIDPDREEINKIQEFVEKVLDHGIQYDSGDQLYGVRKSMFYYEPGKMPEGTYNPMIQFGGWESWNEKEAASTGRSFNYTPVAATHWVLYRLARNYDGLVTNHTWEWYLKRAFQTVMAMQKYAPYYVQFGQMEGTVFVMILEDLQKEGWNDLATQFEEVMKKRADHWKMLDYPFGSEMPWDSTGQEEVYAWCHYFGYKEKADITISAITGYMPTVPHWGYNGNARRYWDFLYAGKLERIERQIHHYGSGLNAIPVLTAYRNNPSDFYLLRIGYGGLMGAISNITQDGFGPCAFHSFPETLKIDGYSGDYGPNFLGHTLNTGTYIVHHPEFGWLTFGGNQQIKGDWIEVVSLDSCRSRIYIAPKGLWLTLDAGQFSKIRISKSLDTIQLTLNDFSGYANNALLHIEQPGDQKVKISYLLSPTYPNERGAFVIPLHNKEVNVELKNTNISQNA